MNITKNRTAGRSAAFKAERASCQEYFNKVPVVGGDEGQKLYDIVKKAIPSLIQASWCGRWVSLTTYKQDAAMAAHILTGVYKVKATQRECQYTGFITTHIKMKS